MAELRFRSFTEVKRHHSSMRKKFSWIMSAFCMVQSVQTSCSWVTVPGQIGHLKCMTHYKLFFITGKYIQNMTWPAYSPNFNPADHAWEHSADILLKFKTLLEPYSDKTWEMNRTELPKLSSTVSWAACRTYSKCASQLGSLDSDGLISVFISIRKNIFHSCWTMIYGSFLFYFWLICFDMWQICIILHNKDTSRPALSTDYHFFKWCLSLL